MSLGKQLTLNNGLKVPQVGFGTWQSAPGEVEKAVAEAIKVGYRHIDCALIYENQNEVAEGIAQGGVAREELVLVSKLWNNAHKPEDVEPQLDYCLKTLNTSYLDVYLIHWPVQFNRGEKLQSGVDTDPSFGIVQTWKEMVRVYKETKKVKAIGVSNFTVEHLKAIIEATGVVPAMNQIEAHPQLIQPELFQFCKENNIIITAYSPLGNNITGKARVIDAPEVKDVAKALNKEPAQVLIAWAVKSGFSVIPKSVTPSRIASNFQQIELSDKDYDAISKWGKANYTRANIPFEYNPKWDINVFNEPEEQSASRKVKIQ